MKTSSIIIQMLIQAEGPCERGWMGRDRGAVERTDRRVNTLTSLSLLFPVGGAPKRSPSSGFLPSDVLGKKKQKEEEWEAEEGEERWLVCW